MQFTIEHIAEITKGNLVQKGEAVNASIKYFSTDSRKVGRAKESVFVALSTKVRDGHKFINAAYEQGVRFFLISKTTIDLNQFPGATFVVVQDTLRSMQLIAGYNRSQYSVPVFGITGSNGKTIVKEWLSRLFAKKYEVVKNPKSYNSQIGVAHALSAMQSYHTLGLFEAGISEPNEMQFLQKMIQPTHGIFTMLGAAHGANFQGAEEKVKEKLRLFTNSETLYYCLDHDDVDAGVNNYLKKQNPNIILKTWGENSNADLVIEKIIKNKGGATIAVNYKKARLQFTLPYTDTAYIENALHCLLVLLEDGTEPNELNTWLADLPPVEMRLELLKGIQDCTLINDTYSSDLASLRIALNFLYEQKQHKKFSLVLSDILQHGNKEEVYDEVIQLLSKGKLEHLVLIGSKIRNFASEFDKVAAQVFHYNDVPHFLRDFEVQLFNQEAILVKGAREYMLERIVNRLEANIHRTVMSINLSAVINNVNAFKRRLKPNTKVMAMVKAFSYGSGSYEIAQTLEGHGVDYFAVAYVDEGILLRKKGIQLPILILNPELTSLDAMLHYDLEPEVYSMELLKQFAHRIQDTSTKLKIHIKLDTGMHRLGVEEKNLAEFGDYLVAAECFTVKSIFSHLVGSDDEKHNSFTQEQKERYIRMSSLLEKKLGYPTIRHLANSAGAVLNEGLQFDMVRLGLGLYGICPNTDLQKELQQISTLKTHVSQIKNLPATETIGYGRAGVLNRDSVIATLNIGYADGFSRQFSQGSGKILIQGKLAPVIGNVCMDMIMVDVTDIPNVHEGDEVIVFGPALSVTELASWIDTIPYEIIAGISRRVKRVFYKE